MIRSVKLAAVAVCLVIGASTAKAGPDWDEVGDAGDLPGFAQIIPGGGLLKSIRGELTGFALTGPGDFEDMYQIIIDDPTIFFFRTVPLVPPPELCDTGDPSVPQQGTSFNTQIWLFKADGTGLLANDDEPGNVPFSFMGNAANDSSGAFIASPGVYYLAISGGPARDPLSISGPIFNQVVTTEVSGPDGAGGIDPIIAWSGPALVGTYEIFVCGTESVPVTGIPTVTEWGMIAMTALMLAAGAILIRRKQQISPSTG